MENHGEKQNKKKIDRNNITRHLLEYQLNMVNKTIKDTLDDDLWYFNWTITTEQEQLFKKYAIALLKKTFKFNKVKAEKTFDWFILNYGLRTKD
jgi:hypothetical protein